MRSLYTLACVAVVTACGGASQTPPREPAPAAAPAPAPAHTPQEPPTEAVRLPRARNVGERLPAGIAITLTPDRIAIDGQTVAEAPVSGSPLHQIEPLASALSALPPVTGPTRGRVTFEADERVDLQALSSVMFTLASNGWYTFEWVVEAEDGSRGRMVILESVPTHPAPPPRTRRLFLGIDTDSYIVARVSEHGGEPTEERFARAEEAAAREQVSHALEREAHRTPNERSITLVIVSGTYGDLIAMMDLALDHQLYLVAVSDGMHL